MIAFAILTFAISWGLSSAISGAMGNAAFGSGLSSLSIGAISAGVYAGVNLLSGTGFTTVQSGWAGSTGDGVLNVDTGAMDQHQLGLLQGVRNLQINSRVGEGMMGAKKLYAGDCPEGKSVAECKTLNLDPSTMYRPDSFAESNTTLLLQEQKVKCEAQIPPSQITASLTDPILKEQLRLWVQQCASPQNGTWDTGW